MGQVALGLRSLMLKLAVFFVMAALLAWALGGNLWPRPEVVDQPGVIFGGERWFWRLEAGGPKPNQFHWRLMQHDSGEKPQPLDERTWQQVVGPIVVEDGLYVGGRIEGGDWALLRVEPSGEVTLLRMPGHLALVQQAARLEAGLPVQSWEAMDDQRSILLDPPSDTADSTVEGGDESSSDR